MKRSGCFYMDAIKFEDFSCYYKNHKEYITALSHLELTVKQGEFLVVVGESGSGKSTLLKACLGLADYFEGDLFIGGATIEAIDLKNGRFAYIRQEIALYPNLNVYENIAFPLRASKMPQQEVDRRVKEMAALVGMEMLLTRKPKQLSGGQQQRVAIARALIKGADYIFMDEPFSSTDVTLRAELRSLIRKIHSQRKPTIVFVTHELDEAFALADRIVVLEKGRIVEAGTPAMLAKAPQSDLLRQYLAGLE